MPLSSVSLMFLGLFHAKLLTPPPPHKCQKDKKNYFIYKNLVYKTEKRLNIANTMTVKDNAKRRHAQMCVFERIGDDASALGMHEIALTFYQRMQKCADRADDKRKAWCSMAESAKVPIL